MAAATRTLTGRLLGVLLAPAVWLERSRGWRRRGLLALYAGIALVVGVFAWRSSRVAGLPDVGDPFDVAAYRRGLPAADRDALDLYRRAVGQRVTWNRRVVSRRTSFPNLAGAAGAGWAQADPEVRREVEAGAEALRIWKLGTDRPDTRPLNEADQPTLAQGLYELACLALLEGSRRAEDGDPAAAWDWVRAALRCSRHLTRRGGIFERQLGTNALWVAVGAVDRWSEDPRAGADVLRRALDDLKGLAATVPPISGTLRVEYLDTMRRLDDLADMVRRFPPFEDSGHAGHRRLVRGWLFLENEPGRTRRIVRMVFANWLASCDVPPVQRPPLIEVERIPVFDDPTSAIVRTRDRWAGVVARLPLVYNSLPQGVAAGAVLGLADREQTAYDAMLMSLAQQLYRREHGAPPKSPRLLVGPYLERLPEAFDLEEPEEPEAADAAAP